MGVRGLGVYGFRSLRVRGYRVEEVGDLPNKGRRLHVRGFWGCRVWG